MQHADLRIDASWIAPVIPRQRILEQHCVLIRDGRIVALLPQTQADRHWQASEHLHLPEQLLIPGLINAHGHTAMSLLRGLADDLPLMRWLEDHIWPAENRWVSAEFVHDGALLGALEMLRGGTTCFSDMYFFPEQTAQAAVRSGLRAQLCFPLFEFPSAWGSGPDQYLELGLRLRDEFAHDDAIQIAFGPHAPYTVGDETLTRIAVLANQLDANIQIHAHETAGEVEQALSQSGERPLARLARLGLLSANTQLVHMTQIDDSDLALLQQYGCSVIHCPESNLKLASGICPVQRLLDAGITVALGTDGAASNNDLDMIGEMRSAALLGKIASGDASALNAHQILEMATINGARALNLDDRIGSIEVGKYADLVAIDLNTPHTQPVYHPVSQLVYAASAHNVSHVWINGQCRVKQQQTPHLPSTQILDNARQWRQKITSEGESA